MQRLRDMYWNMRLTYMLRKRLLVNWVFKKTYRTLNRVVNKMERWAATRPELRTVLDEKSVVVWGIERDRYSGTHRRER